jgi:hypothetical protein
VTQPDPYFGPTFEPVEDTEPPQFDDDDLLGAGQLDLSQFDDEDRRRSEISLEDLLRDAGEDAYQPVELADLDDDDLAQEDDEDEDPDRRAVGSAAAANRMRAIAARCKAYGLKVVSMPGWESRGRGPLGPSHVICHHTAASRDVDGLLRDGRSDLAGPLCNFALHGDGTVVLVASGRANHAGVSKVPSSQSYGIEATGPPFPNYNQYVRLVAAIRSADGWGNDRVLAHKEACLPRGRKIDPTFDMHAFRNHIAQLLSGGPAPAAKKTEDLSIVDAATKAYLDNQFALLQRGTSSGKADSHPNNIEELRLRLIKLGQLVELVRVGDPDADTTGSGETHPGNLDTIYRMLSQVNHKVDQLVADLAAPDPAAPEAT